MKKLLSLLLAITLLFSLVGCRENASGQAGETTVTTAPEETTVIAQTTSVEETTLEPTTAATTEATTAATTETTTEVTTTEATTVTTTAATTVTTTQATTTTKATTVTTVTTKTSTSSSTTSGKKGFLSVDGRKIVDDNGKEYVIKAMGLSNKAHDYIPKSSWVNGITHTEETYKELAEMGFNSVRFLFNYNLFEDDNNPYKYKKDGFEWIDLNIKWAKKYGIKLILNLHAPQGGFQSWDREKYMFDGYHEGDALWMNSEYQKRFTALWAEIAKYYADEPTIIGYGLINEPMVAMDGINYNNLYAPEYQECYDKYEKLIENTVKSIRKYDKNHILFVERIVAFKDTNKTWGNWVDANDDCNFVLIDDPNVAYEFHFYKPGGFTHQEIGATDKLTIYGKNGGTQFEDLLKELKPYVEFSKKYNVPVFCGEYGMKAVCFWDNAKGQNRGGAQWVKDVLGYLLENGIGSGYHCYYGGNRNGNDFGMYVTYSQIKVGSSQRNEVLYQTFVDTFAKYK